MQLSRFEAVRRVFAQALEQPVVQRAQFVRRRCGEDVALAHEVESLLQHVDAGRGALAEGVLGGDFRLHDWLTSPAMDAKASFDGFHLEARIGQGGMGVVYAARQDNPPRRVAIKILRDELASAEMWRRFQQEIRALARLEHPSIAPIYAAGILPTLIGRRPYLAMKLLEGRPLLEYSGLGALSTAQRLNLFLQVCAAVAHAHQQGVIHRDLKSSNVMVEETSAGPRACVLDFGVARLVGEPFAEATRSGVPIGTLGYMSPEQAFGRRGEIDTRSDVYSLGVILYELLTGAMPLAPTESLSEALRQVELETPPPLSRRDRRLRGNIETIVACCLEKDKARRYGSVERLVNDIERYLRNEPITARPPTVSQSLALFARRHRTPVALGGLVILTIVAATIGLVVAFARLKTAYGELEQRYQSALDRAAYSVRVAVDSLGPIAGSQSAQRCILEHARDELAEMLQHRPDDDRAALLNAEILLRLSAIELSEGHADTALQLRTSALPLNESLFARHPSERDVARQLALNLVLIGDISNEAGDAAAAAPWFHRALNIHREEVRLRPDDAHALDDLAWSCFRTGGLSACVMPTNDAFAFDDEGLQAAERLLQLSADGSSALRATWHLTMLRATLARSGGRVDEAKCMIAELEPISEQLRAAFPDDRFAVRCVIETELQLARLCSDPHESAQHAAAGLSGARRLFDLEPRSREAQSLTAELTLLHAGSLTALGRAREAVELLRDPLARAAARLADQPSSANACAEHVRTAVPMLDAYEQLGDQAACETLLERIRASLPDAGTLALADERDIAEIVGKLLHPRFEPIAAPQFCLRLIRRITAQGSCGTIWSLYSVRALRLLGHFDEARAAAHVALEGVRDDPELIRALMAEIGLLDGAEQVAAP